ncbi:hypothetical protein BT69DRAFT_1306737, partial [Atractiella rhizophila]
MTMEAAELVPGGFTNQAGSGDNGAQEPIKDLVDDVSTGTGFDAGSYIPPAAADPSAGASSLLLLANASHPHAPQKTAWPSSRLQPDIPAGSMLKQTSRIYFNCRTFHSNPNQRATTSCQPHLPNPIAQSTFRIDPTSYPPFCRDSESPETHRCDRNVWWKCGCEQNWRWRQKCGGAIASGGGGGGVDTTNGARSGFGTGGRGEHERGNAVPDSRIRLAYKNASHASWAAANPGNSGARLVKGWIKYLWTLSSLTRQLLLRID